MRTKSSLCRHSIFLAMCTSGIVLFLSKFAFAYDHYKDDPDLSYHYNSDDDDDDVSEYFWYNLVTGVSQWERPNVIQLTDEHSGITYYMDRDEVKNEVPWDPNANDEFHKVWHVHKDEQYGTGRYHFYNPWTDTEGKKVAQWDRPKSLGWVKKDPHNKYWHNGVTHERVYDRHPHHAKLESEEQPGKFYYIDKNGEATWKKTHDWEEAYDKETGQRYYTNTNTRENTWEMPHELAWAQHHRDAEEDEFFPTRSVHKHLDYKNPKGLAYNEAHENLQPNPNRWKRSDFGPGKGLHVPE